MSACLDRVVLRAKVMWKAKGHHRSALGLGGFTDELLLHGQALAGRDGRKQIEAGPPTRAEGRGSRIWTQVQEGWPEPWTLGRAKPRGVVLGLLESVVIAMRGNMKKGKLRG